MVNFLTTLLDFQSRSFSKSISGVLNITPWVVVSSASVITFAVCSNALEGIQPTLRQTPPMVVYLSISITDFPKSAALNAAV